MARSALCPRLLFRLFWCNSVVIVLGLVVMSCSISPQEYPQKVYVQMNMTEIYLNCTTNKEVAWLLNDVPIVKGGLTVTSDSRIKIIIGTHTKQLHIEDILSNYTGMYQCMEYHYGQIKNTSIAVYEVIVIQDLTVGDQVTNVSVVEGTNVKLTCSILGRPEPIIHWYISGESLIDTGIKGKILEIVNFTRECAVPYICIAENEFSNIVNNTITPIPEFPPEIQISVTGANETNSGVQIGYQYRDKFNFSCIITANPFSKLMWLLNDNILAYVTMPENPKDQPVISRNNDIATQYEYNYNLMPNESERYTYIATLTGRFLDHSMFCEYLCFVENKHGADNKTIDVIEMKKT